MTEDNYIPECINIKTVLTILLSILITFVVTVAICSILFQPKLEPEPLKGPDRPFSNNESKDMAYTIYPIIYDLCQEKCNVTIPICPLGKKCKIPDVTLIYKRENKSECISDIGNVYYCRCYEWWASDITRIENGTKKECFKFEITEDVPIGSFSCMPEDLLFIPFYKKKLADINVNDIVNICV